MSKLKVGYSQLVANPPLGIGVAGYYIPRYASGFIDDIEVSAMVLSLGDKEMALVAIDTLSIANNVIDEYKALVQEKTRLDKDSVMLCASHTHTGPLLTPTDRFEVDEEMIFNYKNYLGERIAEAVALAKADQKETKVGYSVCPVPAKVAYIRRYKMKDGTTFTCPPINDQNIDHAIGELDERVNIVRFTRDGADDIVLLNYGVHADTTNGDKISADWPGWMRKTVEMALDGTRCMFFPGAEGDVGSTNVFPSGGDMNDTEISFDNEMKSPGMARFVGRAMAGCVLQVYDKVNYVDVEDVNFINKVLKVKANTPKKEEIPLAEKYVEYHLAGKDELIPFKAMQLTTVLAESYRILDLKDGPEYFDLRLTGVKIGPIALIGIAGEPFTEIGVKIQDIEGWDLIMPCALTNGSVGYFPNKSAYDEGGYEAKTSRFAPGVAETIIDGAKELLEELKNS